MKDEFEYNKERNDRNLIASELLVLTNAYNQSVFSSDFAGSVLLLLGDDDSS